MTVEMVELLVNAGSGLLGTLLGGIIAYATLRSQLRHEAGEKERDRKLSLRRDVYMEAAAAIGRFQLFLGSFSRQDIALNELVSQLQDVPGALNRAQLVASEETFEALEQFGDFFGSSATSLLTLRMRVDHLQNEIKNEQVTISSLHEKLARKQAQLAELTQGGPLLLEDRNVLFGIHAELDAGYDKLVAFTDEHVRAIEELGRAAFEATLQAQVEAGRVNVQIRRELELPLSEGWYISRLQRRAERLRPKIDEVYGNVRQLFEETENVGRSGQDRVEPHGETGKNPASEPRNREPIRG